MSGDACVRGRAHARAGTASRLTRLLAGLVTTTIVLGGCSNHDGGRTDPTAKDDMTPTEQLIARPTAEEVAQTYSDQLVRIRSALRGLAPDVEWDNGAPVDAGGSGCAHPFDGVDGTTTASLVTGGAGAIPDEDWDRAVALTRRLLEPDGYDRTEVTVDRPGQHAASFFGPYGAEISLSGQRNTSIGVSGGCFLTAEAHQSDPRDK